MCRTDQSKGSQDWQSLDAVKAEFNKAQNDDDDVEAAPLVLEVFVQAEREDLETRLDGKYRREHLQCRQQPYRSRIPYLSKEKSRILKNFPKLKNRKNSYNNSLNARV